MARDERQGISRREAMKRTLQAGAYAAPAILSISAATAHVSAASPAPPRIVTFRQDAALTGTGAGATFDVYYTLNTQPAAMLTLAGSFMTDRFGFGFLPPFPLTVDINVVTSVTITYYLHGNAPPLPPAATFPSRLVALLAAPAASFTGLVVQEPTIAACQVGPLTQFNEYIDVAIVNGPPNTAYDFYVQPNTLGAPVKVTTAATNANGTVTVFAPTPAPITSATVPASVTVSAVLAGGLPTSPAFTLTASGATLTTISCTDLQSLSRIRALGIAPR